MLSSVAAPPSTHYTPAPPPTAANDNCHLRLVYDRSDQPIILTGTITGNYIYDGNKKRVKSTAGGSTIYNIYDASGSLVHIDDLTTAKKITYIDKLARVTQLGTTSPVTTYLHHDHLGSAVSGTLQSGAVNWTERYTPFGEKLLDPLANRDQASFTGHIDDQLTGLTYMQARYYEPVIGRFLSVDPVTFLSSGENPDYFNSYAYTFNDPVNGVDPTGEQTVSSSFDAPKASRIIVTPSRIAHVEKRHGHFGSSTSRFKFNPILPSKPTAGFLAVVGQLPATTADNGNFERVIPTGTVGQLGENAIKVITRPLDQIDDPELRNEVQETLADPGNQTAPDSSPGDEVLITAYPVFLEGSEEFEEPNE